MHHNKHELCQSGSLEFCTFISKRTLISEPWTAAYVHNHITALDSKLAAKQTVLIFQLTRKIAKHILDFLTTRLACLKVFFVAVSVTAESKKNLNAHHDL